MTDPVTAFKKYRKNVCYNEIQELVTMDTPPWYYHWIYRSPGHNQMKRTILGFCGIKVNRISEFSPIKGSSQEKRDKWLKKAEVLGKKA